MSYAMKAVLVDPHQRAEVVFSFAHHRSGQFLVLFSRPQQALFFNDVLLSHNFKNLRFGTFQEFLEAPSPSSATGVFLLDAPESFQLMESLLRKAQDCSQQLFIVLLKDNKKYLQILSKKVPVVSTVCSFSANKFVGINDKLRDLVEKNYDLNRAAFYAYGSFINTFRSNPLKRIFRTEQIDVQKLALGFGFTTPPRVKEGHFLTRQAQLNKLRQKKVQRASIQGAASTEKVVSKGKSLVPVVASSKKIPKQKKIQKLERVQQSQKVQKKEKVGKKVVSS